MITLGLVDSVDDNGVYVTMPGSRGVLRGPYRSIGDVAAGSSVLVQQTDDGEQVVVGTLGTPPRSGVYNVKDYGATGDGSTDDSAAINAAVAAAHAAGGGTVIFPPGTYETTRIGIRSNVHYVGYGAVITATQYWAFDARLYTGPHSNVTIEGFRIDCGALSNMGGVILYNTSNATVRNCTVYNIGSGGYGIRFHWLTEGCRAIDNHVTCPEDDPLGTVSSAGGVAATGEATDTHGGGQNDTLTFDPPTANYSRGHVIANNVIYNGTHGVVLFAATDCTVSGNKTKGQTHRGIILSPVASRNTITGNQVEDAGSAGIHMAWGSCDNLVSGNNVWTSTSIWEGDGIKAYYASDRNSIVGNRITGALLRGVRVAMGSRGFLIADNHIQDCTSGVVIESYVNSTDVNHYQPDTPPDVDGWSVIGNHIMDCATGIWLHQGNLTFGEDADQYLRDGVIYSNHVVDATDGVVFTENYTGKISDITAAGNLLRVSGTDWDTPRGSAHFAADETPHP